MNIYSTKKSPLDVAMAQAYEESARRNKRGNQNNGNEMPLEELQFQLVWAAEQMFDSKIQEYLKHFLDSTLRPQLLLATPKFLLTEHYLGNDAVTDAVISTKPETAHLVFELCKRQDAFISVPSSTDLIRFLAEKPEDKYYTFSELFWLNKLGGFLRCTTAEFWDKIVIQYFVNGEVREKLNFSEQHKYFNEGNIKAPIDEIGSITQRQYDAIETFLKRL